MADYVKLSNLIGSIPKSHQALESIVLSSDSAPRDEPMQMSPLRAPTPDYKTSFAPSALGELPPLSISVYRLMPLSLIVRRQRSAVSILAHSPEANPKQKYPVL